MKFIGLTFAVSGIADAVEPQPEFPGAVWKADDEWRRLVSTASAASKLAQAIRNAPYLHPDLRLRWSEHQGPMSLSVVSDGVAGEGLEILDYVSGGAARVSQRRMQAVVKVTMALDWPKVEGEASLEVQREQARRVQEATQGIVHEPIDVTAEAYGPHFLRACRLGFYSPDLLALLGACGVNHSPGEPTGDRMESDEERQRRRFDRFEELGGRRVRNGGGWKSAGERGALARLVEEEKAAGRQYTDEKDVRHDLDKEAERRRVRGTLPGH